MGVKQLVQKKYRITIPKKYRAVLRIREGDEVEVKLERGRIVVVPSWFVPNPTERLSGLVEGIKVSEEPKREIRKAIAERVEKELKG
ncbi:MAG: AbrB/MazE/SpoVT family DNA-binding domain-containing protein [Candidatus Bathyarchaeia archaeon]